MIFACPYRRRGTDSPVMKTYFIEATFCVCSLLVWLQTVKGWIRPEFCNDYDCPEFTLVSKNEMFEKRWYNTSQWLKTEVQDLSISSMKGAYEKLKAYITGQNEAGEELPWTKPLVVTVEYSDDRNTENYFVSFYVAPNTVLPKPSDSSILSFTMPAGPIFVRVFSGEPNVQSLRTNMDELEHDLESAEERYDYRRQMAAAYDSALKLFFRHDEVWIPGA